MEGGYTLGSKIRKAAVLGSGVMGSGIAALLANVGIPTFLLDIVPQTLTEVEKKQGLTLEDKSVRNRNSQAALLQLIKQNPAPLTSQKSLALIETGNFEDDLARLKDVDWIIEVVVENIAVKKSVFEKVDQFRKPGSIISSNTSGISIEAMAEGRSEDFQTHFLGTHFFNPPRYLKLLEVIPTKATNPEVLAFMKTFGEDMLGKGIVIAKDTPNFIANRIGTYGLLVTVREMLKGGYSVGEVDSVTGTLIGRPKSATFRTLDVVGLDTFAHVAKNVYDQMKDEEQKVFLIPEFMNKMLEKGWLGSKAGQGFYVKKGKDILELNPTTFEYEERKKLKAPSIEEVKQVKGFANKLKTLLFSDDRAGQLLWNVLSPVLIYTAELMGEIADDIVSIDQAMKWGFGWSAGPFEIWDAIGVEESVVRMEQEGIHIPQWIKDFLAAGNSTFYREEHAVLFYYDHGRYKQLLGNPKIINLHAIKEQKGVIKKNSGASLIDIGDGIAMLEFTTPNNAIGLDILQMIHAAVDEAEANYKGLVIGNTGKNFCVGANIAMMLMEAQDDNIFELDFVIRQFQNAVLKIKYSSVPVIVAPYHMTLGGGAEVSLAAAQIQATTETYMGLVEAGVGLIPGGGGTKELYVKTLKGLPNGIAFDLQQVANKVFETVALAKVSTSGVEARDNNFLNYADGISVNQDHQLFDAKQVALTLHEQGYTAPVPEKIPVVGESGYATLLLRAESMRLTGYLSDHDMVIAKELAYVLAGGPVPFGTEVDEQYLLNLEREAFLRLISTSKSQQRMQHMLVKGKTLRN